MRNSTTGPWLLVIGAIAILVAYIIWPAWPGGVHPGLFGRPLEVRPGLDVQGGLRVLMTAQSSAAIDTAKMEEVRRVIERRVNSLGLAEPVVQLAGSNRVIIELPGLSDPQRAIDIVQQTALLEFVDFTKTGACQATMPPEGAYVLTDRQIQGGLAPALATPTLAVTPTVGTPGAPTTTLTLTATSTGTITVTAAVTSAATQAATDSIGAAGTMAATSAATVSVTDAATSAATQVATQATTPVATSVATAQATATQAVTLAALNSASVREIRLNRVQQGTATAAATVEATIVATAAVTSAATSIATTLATPAATLAATETATPQATQQATVAVTPAATLPATDLATPAVTAEVTSVATTMATVVATSESTLAATVDATQAATPVVTVPGQRGNPLNNPCTNTPFRTIMTGAGLQTAEAGIDSAGGTRYVVNFQLANNPEAEAFARHTAANVNQPMAIVVDGEVLSAPTIQSALTTGGVITGNFTREEAQQLALQLRSGALPVSLSIDSVEQVGASLGQQSVTNSIRAGILGVLVVFLFMLIFYRFAGLAAVLALLLFAAINFALYKFLPVTLTLSAITGFLISIGTAVDGNVLIFERIKEELRAGRPLLKAIDLGFERAWPSIRESNISTILIALVLYFFGGQFGASAVRGFAVTMILGLVVNLFTAVFVTRQFLNIIVALGGERLRRVKIFGG